jgi:DNA helicase TIP49 (TBP-interacting protein)
MNVLFYYNSRLLPESIRWLLSKNKQEEARGIIKKVAKMNKVVLTEETLENMTKPEEKTDIIKAEKKYTALDLCRPKMLLLSLNVWFNW